MKLNCSKTLPLSEDRYKSSLISDSETSRTHVTKEKKSIRMYD